MDKIRHIAFICDGNGRWAKAQGKERTYGHNVGSDVVKDITMHIKRNHDIEMLSFYIFSTENWKRPKIEVNFILKMLELKLNKWYKLFLEENFKLQFIGYRGDLDKKIVKMLEKYENLTKHCDGMTINICFNYGGRKEIVEAAKSIVRDNVAVEDIDEEIFGKYLYNNVDIDLLIRTSGEQRISNFYLWQLAYSEMEFLDCYWPELTNEIIDESINEFKKRNRRFGGI